MNLYFGEFIGTLLLILLGNGVVANVVLKDTKGHGAGWIVITMGWGMAVFVAVWCVAPISGGHINPAVTLAAAVAGKFEWSLVPGYIVAQMLGASAGATLVYLFYREHYLRTDDQTAMLATFATIPAIKQPFNNLFNEAVGTAVLMLAVLSVVEPSLEAEATQSVAAEAQILTIGLGTLGALPVGLVVFAIGLSLGGTTGYAINPARDLGPRIAHALLPIAGKGNSDWPYAWIPVVGPIAGAILAVGIKTLLD